MYKRMTMPIVLVTLAVFMLLSAQLLRAQDRAGTLQGVVKNSSGTPLAGAFVKMKNAERRLTFMVVTQAQGRYSVNTLPTGKYVVQGIGGDYQSELRSEEHTSELQSRE